VTKTVGRQKVPSSDTAARTGTVNQEGVSMARNLFRKFQTPLNVYLRPGSRAELSFRARTGFAQTELPAPGFAPTPSHDLKFRGGKTIPALSFANLYVGSDGWDSSDVKNIDTALAAAMSDQNLNNVMAQYFAEPITSTFLGSVRLPGPAPQVASQGDIEQLAAMIFNQGMLRGIDLSQTVFNFLLPPGSILNTDLARTSSTQKKDSKGKEGRGLVEEDEGDSLNGLGGYHGSVHVSASVIYYAVGAYSQVREDGSVNGIPVFGDSWKNVVATFYHELNEARTDPDVEDSIRAGNAPGGDALLGWVSDQGEECGDFPVAEADSDLSKVFREVLLTDGSDNVPVQFQYSNAVHGPEGPIPQPLQRVM
jgi:hypothetical protein